MLPLCRVVCVISMTLIFYCSVCQTEAVKYSDNVLEFLKITHELGERTFSLRTTLSFTSDCVVRLTGCNGCGKTTLLDLMSHLQRGEVKMRYQGREIAFRDPSYCQKVNYISLHDPLPEFMTVADYINYQKFPADSPLVRDMNSRQKIAKLSSGMRQRLRLLPMMQDAAIHYIDEPYNALEAAHCEMLDQMVENKAKNGQLIIYASHIAGYSTQELDCEAIISLS